MFTRALCGRSFLILFLSLFISLNALPQSLAGYRIGDPAVQLTSLGPALAEDQWQGMHVQRWLRADHNDLSVTTDPNGKIAYVEADWNGVGAEVIAPCDLSGLRFGATTLNELRQRFGSNGFAFEKRGGVIQAPEGIVMLNSYGIDDVVVTFYTRVNEAQYRKAQAVKQHVDVSDFATLVGISLASNRYAQSNWGERVFDPEYKSPAWK